MTARLLSHVLVAAVAVSEAFAGLEPSPPAQGVLVAVGSDGKPLGPCPMTDTSSRTEQLSCCVVRFEVTQTFKNTYADRIKALYVVPLKWHMRVEEVQIMAGPQAVRELLDFSRRPSDATHAFMAAQEAGHLGRPDSEASHGPAPRFQVLNDVAPDQEVVVKLRYFELLEPNPPYDIRIANAEAAGELIDRVNKGEITEEAIHEQVKAEEETEAERVRRWEAALTPEQKRCKEVDKLSRELRLAAAGIDTNIWFKEMRRYQWGLAQDSERVTKQVHIVDGRAHISVSLEEFSESALQQLRGIGFQETLLKRRSKGAVGTIDLKRLEDLALLTVVRRAGPHRANREGEEPAFVPGEVLVGYKVDEVQVCPIRAAKEGKTLVALTGNSALASLDRIHANPDLGLDLLNARKSLSNIPQTGSLIEDRRIFQERTEAIRQKRSARHGPPPGDSTQKTQPTPTLASYYTIPCRVGKEEEAAAALGNDPSTEYAGLNRYFRIVD